MAEAVAWAVAEIGAAIGGTSGAFAIMYSTEIATAITAAAAVATVRQQQIRAEQKSRAAYNNSQKDRYVMSRGGLEPRQLVLGRRRVSGPMFYIGSYGTDNEVLVFTLALASHEVDAVEAIYFDDEPVLLDGSGNVVGVLRTEQFSIAAATGTFTIGGKAKAGSVTAEALYGSDTVTLGVTVTGTSVAVTGARVGEVGELRISYQPDPCPYSPVQSQMGRQVVTLDTVPKTITLPQTPDPSSVSVVQGLIFNETSLTYTVSGASLTITSGTVGQPCTVAYSYTGAVPYARVRVHLGTQDQPADSGLIAARPEHWTSAHKASGVAYLVVELAYNRDAYSGGVPNVSARLRGMKCYDPRLNLLPNPLAAGAVPGTPGTPPSGWTVFTPPGLSSQIVSAGTDRSTGLPCLAVRIYGSATGAGNVVIGPATNSNGPAASPGQGWSARAWVRREPGGTSWGVWTSASLQLTSYTSGGAPTTEASVAVATVDGNHDPLQLSDTSMSAGTVRTGLQLVLGAPSGVGIDMTVVMLLPMLWPGSIGSATDPRRWTENVALLTSAYATHPLGGRLPWDQVDVPWLNAQANICDTTATYTVGGADYVRPLYTAGYSALTNQRPTDVLTDLCLAMGGEWIYSDGRLRVKAGAWRAPVLTLDESWLQGDQPIQIQGALDREDLVNARRGSYYDETRDYRQTDFTPLEPDVYIAEDKAKLAQPVDYGAVTFRGQASYLSACDLRAARQGMTLAAKCNMRAWQAEPFDNLYVNLSRFGFAGKVFEVRSAGFSLEGGIDLVLRETDASTWDMDAGFPGLDPAPNTRLPDPRDIPDVTSLALASGTTWLLLQSDGTVVPRMRATWTALTDPRVLEPGGAVEIRYGLAADPVEAWQTLKVPGGDSEAFLTGVQDTRLYLVQARSVGAVGLGNWTNPVLHLVVGKSALPADVSGLGYSVIYGAVPIRWAANSEPDYSHTELRRGASWAAGVPLTGSSATESSSNEYLWAWPAQGSYTVWAKHFDTSGNASATAASLAVTVSAAIGVDTSGIQSGAVTGSTITNTSTTTGTSAGSSVIAGFYVGPPVTTTATDQLDFTITGQHRQELYFQASLLRVEIWMERQASTGGAYVEFGKRRIFTLSPEHYSLVTYIPIDQLGVDVPGAGTWDYYVQYRVTSLDAAGSPVAAQGDYTADAQWRVVTRKR